MGKCILRKTFLQDLGWILKMSHKFRLSSQNDFLRLEQAVESIIAAEDDDMEIDLIVVPPDPAFVSDEEEGGEDDLVSSSLPRDIPGTIELSRRQPSDEEWDSSDDEPLSNVGPARKRSRNEVADKPNWRKILPIYSTTHVITQAVQDRQQYITDSFETFNPTQLFELFFDDEVLNLIVNHSILYAGQNNRHNFEVTTQEMKSFLGILLLSGYHKLPSERAYWSLDEDLGVAVVNNCMSRNRFHEIKRNLHFADNTLAEGSHDKMYKLRPLCDLLGKNACQWGVFHEDLSVDESMIKYFGHHPAKQFIRGKPVRFGYKNWAITSSDGYCYGFDVYCGKSLESSTDPLGSRVVKSLLQKLPISNPQNHKVYFDNFFTNYSLLQDLRVLGYRATGTVRDNRTKKCPLTSLKEMNKKPRAAYDYRFDKKNEILFVRWKDNSVCTIGTNFDNVEPLGKVKRWCSTSKQKVDVNIPHLFQNYNRGMGGVDQMDQSISLYRVSIRGKKWWWVIFTYLVDMAVSNAWRLHVLAAKKGNTTCLDQLAFRRAIARSYLPNNRAKTRPSSSSASNLCSSNGGHNPERIVNPLRCVICHNRGRWRCAKCLKTLCVERPCFGQFHT